MTDATTTTDQPFHFLDSLAAVRADAATTGGGLGITEFWGKRGHGSPLMTHDGEDEGYLVLDGEIEWRAGDHPPVRYGPGGFAWAARGVPHAYTVSSDAARFLCVTTPAGLEGFFRTVGVPAGHGSVPEAGSVDDEVAGRAMAAVAEYGVTIVGPPPGL